MAGQLRHRCQQLLLQLLHETLSLSADEYTAAVGVYDVIAQHSEVIAHLLLLVPGTAGVVEASRGGFLQRVCGAELPLDHDGYAWAMQGKVEHACVHAMLAAVYCWSSPRSSCWLPVLQRWWMSCTRCRYRCRPSPRTTSWSSYATTSTGSESREFPLTCSNENVLFGSCVP